MPEIIVRANQRVLYVGKTGSGKTYLARHILAPIKRLIVLDPKATLGTPEWNLESGRRVEKLLLDGKSARLRVLAPPNNDWRYWLDLAWRAKNITVYIDEIYGVVPPGKRAPDELNALYTRGRELEIGVQGATQRPTWLPPFTMSEAEWMFVFRLSRPQDRKIVAAFGDEYQMMAKPIRDTNGFWTYNQTWRKPIYTPKFRASVQTNQRSENAHVKVANSRGNVRPVLAGR